MSRPGLLTPHASAFVGGRVPWCLVAVLGLTATTVLLLTSLHGTAAAAQPDSTAPARALAVAPATAPSVPSTTAATAPRLAALAPPTAAASAQSSAVGSRTRASGQAGGLDRVGAAGRGTPSAARGVPGLPGIPGVPGMGCGLLDAICPDLPGGLPGGGLLPGIPRVPDIPGVHDAGDAIGDNIPGLGDIPNPMSGLGDAIAKAAVDAWTAAMMAIWNSGLMVLRLVLTLSEMFLTPDLSADGPGKDVYEFTLWMALAMVVILTVVQLGAAAFKREGKGLGRALIGAGQFVIVCACWFGYCSMIVAACGAITRALMGALLDVDTWPEWDPLGGLGGQDIVDGTVATVLAFLGIFLWLAAIGHLLVYLARAASLLILTATGPLAAAGLVSDFTRSWFWKSLRWFHAAAFTPVLMVMVLGIGVQFSNGVAAGLSDDAFKSIGTALPAVMVMLVSVTTPLALFKLLAFVDPGSPSGASFRQGMAVQGGVQGMLSGGGAGGGGGEGSGSSAASSSDTSGKSSGESSAESSTGDRFNKSTQGALGGLGGVGQALSAGMGLVTSAGAKGTSLISDETNQAGVGQHTYGPDFSGARSGQQGGQSGWQSGGRGSGGDPGDPDGGGPGGPDDEQDGDAAVPPMPPPPPIPPPNLPSGGQQGGQQGGQGGSGGKGSGGQQGRARPPGGGGAGSGGAAGGAVGGAAVPVA